MDINGGPGNFTGTLGFSATAYCHVAAKGILTVETVLQARWFGAAPDSSKVAFQPGYVVEFYTGVDS